MATLQAIRIQVPVGIPTSDGGLEIPNRIFLGGIPLETTELELELFFSDYGTVRDVRIVTDRITGHGKGYGFVTFEMSDDIEELLRKKTVTMKGRKLRIRRAVRRNGSQFQSVPVDDAMLSGPHGNSMMIEEPAPLPISMHSPPIAMHSHNPYMYCCNENALINQWNRFSLSKPQPRYEVFNMTPCLVQAAHQIPY